MNFTREQQAIFDAAPESYRICKIIALAGTGKTTTLAEYARRYPNKKFLYLVFNKAAVAEARIKFPANCECLTIHSHAFRFQRESYIEKKKAGVQSRLRSSLSLPYISRITGITDGHALRQINRVIDRFCLDTNPVIDRDSIPESVREKISGKAIELKEDPVARIALYEQYLHELIDAATLLWNACFSPEPGETTYSIFLKRAYLQGMSFDRYDVVMLDEAQDSDPVTIELLKRAKLLMLVGDPHQQIYRFRGAVNAMDQFKEDLSLSLTGSFRFGPDLAKQANLVLTRLKGEFRTLAGLGSLGGGRTDSTCYVARTNAGIIEQMLQFGQQPYRLESSLNVKDLNVIEDIYWLYKDDRTKITSEELLEIDSFQALQAHAEESGDAIIERNCLLVEKYKDDCLMVLNKIKTAIRHPCHEGPILTTAHKAKGREYDLVIMIDDFKLPWVQTAAGWEYRPKASDEVNLLYVALTRARRQLTLSPKVKIFLSALQAGLIPADEKHQTGMHVASLQFNDADSTATYPDKTDGCESGKEIHKIDTTPVVTPLESAPKKLRARLVKKNSHVSGSSGQLAARDIDSTGTDNTADLKPIKSDIPFASIHEFMSGSLGLTPWTPTMSQYFYDQYDDESYFENESSTSSIDKDFLDWTDSFDDLDSDYWEEHYDISQDPELQRGFDFEADGIDADD